MQQKNNVHCVILNYKNADDTLECVRSVKAGSMQVNIIVVENCSGDGSAERLKKETEGITLIEMPENLGYAGGNNAGIRHALEKGATHVWILNNDTVVDKNAAFGLVKCLEDNPSAGMAGSFIVFYDRPDEIWFAGGIYDPFKGLTSHYLENETVGESRKVLSGRGLDYVSGCSFMMTSAALCKAGMFDEALFLLFEEIDICSRVRKAGFDIVMTADSVVLHKVSRTLKDSPMRLYYFTRNRLYASFKHYRLFFPFVLLWCVRWPLLPALFKKSRKENLKYVLKAFSDFFSGRTGAYSEK